MNTALWIVQALLGSMMLIIGYMKTFQSTKQLSKFSWTKRSSEAFIRIVGISELLVGAGLILPWLTGVLPMLTSMAAVALCVIMVLAIAEHVRHKETSDIGKNVIILLLAAFVAVERFVPFQ
jgi:uncharacterized membrane protein YphA (DoxX/SURF4 family)